jgi:hypothetical protein
MWLSISDDAGRLENGITQVQDKKAKHERDGIATVDEGIGNHHPGVDKQLDDHDQEESIDKFYESFGC